MLSHYIIVITFVEIYSSNFCILLISIFFLLRSDHFLGGDEKEERWILKKKRRTSFWCECGIERPSKGYVKCGPFECKVEEINFGYSMILLLPCSQVSYVVPVKSKVEISHCVLLRIHELYNHKDMEKSASTFTKSNQLFVKISWHFHLYTKSN